MRGRVAEAWGAADQDHKVVLMPRAKERRIPLDIELLDISRRELDEYAQLVGTIPVYVSKVDAAGLSCRTPGGVSSELAGKYRRRLVKPSIN